jgi:nucleoside-diphosphate-sugar epimerase
MVRQVKLQSDSSAASGHSGAGICLMMGCGYTAQAVAPALKNRGFKLVGTTRSTAKADQLQVDGIEPVLFSGAVGEELRTVLKNVTHIISSIAPDGQRDPVIRAFEAAYGKDWPRHLPHLQWVAYLSATSVYGDRAGQWVFEEELLYPQTPRGKARVLAELDWVESGAPVHIFRIAGIYGPGRNAFKRIENGTVKALIKPGHISNRIHVDDIATALLASIDRPLPHRIYNLADDRPAPPQEVLQYAAKLLGAAPLPEVPFDQAEMTDMARSFYKEVRRTSNTRAKDELDWWPKYPSYKEGLQAILQAEKNR